MAPHDPEAKLYRKAQGSPAKLQYLGRALKEHRTGQPVDVEVTEAKGFAGCEASLRMLDRLPRRSRRTLATDKTHHTADFVGALLDRQVTPTSPPITVAGEARRSTGAARAMRATGRANGCASRWRRSSAGARTVGRCAR